MTSPILTRAQSILKHHEGMHDQSNHGNRMGGGGGGGEKPAKSRRATEDAARGRDFERVDRERQDAKARDAAGRDEFTRDDSKVNGKPSKLARPNESAAWRKEWQSLQEMGRGKKGRREFDLKRKELENKYGKNRQYREVKSMAHDWQSEAENEGLRHEVDDALRGKKPTTRARILLREVDAAPQTDRELVRVHQVRMSPSKFQSMIRAGRTLDVGSTSFSSDLQAAESQFRAQVGAGPYVRVTYHLAPGAKAFGLGTFAESPQLREYITSGRFRVDRVEFTHGGNKRGVVHEAHVYLTQTGIFQLSRIVARKAVEFTALLKHLPGVHDQSAHGTRHGSSLHSSTQPIKSTSTLTPGEHPGKGSTGKTLGKRRKLTDKQKAALKLKKALDKGKISAEHQKLLSEMASAPGSKKTLYFASEYSQLDQPLLSKFQVGMNFDLAFGQFHSNVNDALHTGGVQNEHQYPVLFELSPGAKAAFEEGKNTAFVAGRFQITSAQMVQGYGNGPKHVYVVKVRQIGLPYSGEKTTHFTDPLAPKGGNRGHKALDVARVLLKHYEGMHDQSTHGNRMSGGGGEAKLDDNRGGIAHSTREWRQYFHEHSTADSLETSRMVREVMDAKFGKDPEYRRVRDTLSEWSGAPKGKQRQIVKEVEQEITREGHSKRARTIIREINRSPLTDRELYQDGTYRGNEDALLRRFAKGERFDLPLASFSANESPLNSLLIRGSRQKIPIRFELVGKAKAMPLGAFGLYTDAEYLTSGQFQVLSVTRVKSGMFDRDGFVIRIRHVGTPRLRADRKIELALEFISLLKHYEGMHDQSTHGDRMSGGGGGRELERAKLSVEQTRAALDVASERSTRLTEARHQTLGQLDEVSERIHDVKLSQERGDIAPDEAERQLEALHAREAELNAEDFRGGQEFLEAVNAEAAAYKAHKTASAELERLQTIADAKSTAGERLRYRGGGPRITDEQFAKADLRVRFRAQAQGGEKWNESGFFELDGKQYFYKETAPNHAAHEIAAVEMAHELGVGDQVLHLSLVHRDGKTFLVAERAKLRPTAGLSPSELEDRMDAEPFDKVERMNMFEYLINDIDPHAGNSFVYRGRVIRGDFGFAFHPGGREIEGTDRFEASPDRVTDKTSVFRSELRARIEALGDIRMSPKLVNNIVYHKDRYLQIARENGLKDDEIAGLSARIDHLADLKARYGKKLTWNDFWLETTTARTQYRDNNGLWYTRHYDGMHDQSTHGDRMSGGGGGVGIEKVGKLPRSSGTTPRARLDSWTESTTLQDIMAEKYGKTKVGGMGGSTDSPVGDDALHAMIHEQGFDHKPQVVSGSQMDFAIDMGDTEMHRASSLRNAENMINGDRWYIGQGVNGNGTYFGIDYHDASSYEIAEGYAMIGGDGYKVYRFALKDDALVTSAEDLQEYRVQVVAKMRSMGWLPPQGAQLTAGQQALAARITDDGFLAAMLGFDAIAIPDVGSMVVVNRGALRVQRRPVGP